MNEVTQQSSYSMKKKIFIILVYSTQELLDESVDFESLVYSIQELLHESVDFESQDGYMSQMMNGFRTYVIIFLFVYND